jgi:transcriptional regulator with XRE-family HTH domain
MPKVDYRFVGPEVVTAEIGRRIKAHRLRCNLDQRTVAERSGVGLKTLRALEQGTGSTVETLVRVMKGLDMIQALDGFLPEPSVSPIAVFEMPRERRRAYRFKGGTR